MAGGSCKLLVKHLPSLLNNNDKKDLLKHFGAMEVICMGRSGKMCNSAFAEFSDEATATKALSRLHQLEVLGSRLVVEFAKAQHEKVATEECSRLSPDKNVESEETAQKEGETIMVSSETPDEAVSHSLTDTKGSSKLGINYKPNPGLHYLYPPPSAAILTNIAHALACAPKFYIQVLHLMNKMNLPAPFGPVTAVPPVASDSIIVDDERMLSSEESEIESDEEEKERRTKERIIAAQRGTAVKSVKHDVPSRKRPSSKLKTTHAKRPKTGTSSKLPIESAFEQPSGQQTRKIEFKLTDAITAIFESGPPPIEPTEPEVVPVDTEGFGKFEPPPEPTVLETEEEPAVEEESDEFISLAELVTNRMSDQEIRSMSSFKKYEAGDPTSRLYIKNLARHVEEKDLRYIFGRYTRNVSQEEVDRYDIRLMKEGRMKGQAFVTLPTEELAKKALKEVHGYVLQGKPMVIQFARSAKAKD